MTNIETFEDACKAIGIDAATVLPNVSGYPDYLQRHLLAAAKLLIINKALNGDWVRDFSFEAEAKYYIRFDADATEKYPNGFAVYETSDHGERASSTLLNEYKTEELAEYAGKQFLSLFKDLYTF